MVSHFQNETTVFLSSYCRNDSYDWDIAKALLNINGGALDNSALLKSFPKDTETRDAVNSIGCPRHCKLVLAYLVERRGPLRKASDFGDFNVSQTYYDFARNKKRCDACSVLFCDALPLVIDDLLDNECRGLSDTTALSEPLEQCAEGHVLFLQCALRGGHVGEGKCYGCKKITAVDWPAASPARPRSCSDDTGSGGEGASVGATVGSGAASTITFSLPWLGSYTVLRTAVPSFDVVAANLQLTGDSFKEWAGRELSSKADISMTETDVFATIKPLEYPEHFKVVVAYYILEYILSIARDKLEKRIDSDECRLFVAHMWKLQAIGMRDVCVDVYAGRKGVDMLRHSSWLESSSLPTYSGQGPDPRLACACYGPGGCGAYGSDATDGSGLPLSLPMYCNCFLSQAKGIGKAISEASCSCC